MHALWFKPLTPTTLNWSVLKVDSLRYARRTAAPHDVRPTT